VTAPARKLNPERYGRLLAETLPTVIKTEGENERILCEIERLMDKGPRLTREELALLELMSQLVEDFEEEAYPVEASSPAEVLQHLMDANGLKQADLVPVFGSRARVSEAVNGVRGISKEQAKRLAAFFGVSAEVFI
jgi:HTH-type transcriptional regulator / antitoxin HigA